MNMAIDKEQFYWEPCARVEMLQTCKVSCRAGLASVSLNPHSPLNGDFASSPYAKEWPYSNASNASDAAAQQQAADYFAAAPLKGYAAVHDDDAFNIGRTYSGFLESTLKTLDPALK